MTGESGLTRLFVALPVADSFAQAADGLPRSGLDANWVSRADYHITLRFLGNVAAADSDRVTDALNAVRGRAFPVVVEGLCVFDDAVLFARIANPRPLNALAADIGDALAPLGFDPPVRAFTPHITLARLNRDNGVDTYMRHHSAKLRAQWPATEFCLIQSAKPYKTLSRWPLAPA